MSKQCKLVDVSKSTASRPQTPINWELCVLCQGETAELLQCPAVSKRQHSGAGYRSLANNLMEFSELGELAQHVDLTRLDEGEGIIAALISHRAKWHKSCRLKYNNTKLQRVLKRKLPEQEHGPSTRTPPKRTRSQEPHVDGTHNTCFFCHLDLGSDYHQAVTLELDQRVRQAAEFLEDTTLLAKLSAGDMVAIEAKYHNRCLVSLYNRVRAVQKSDKQCKSKADVFSAVVLAELVTYIEESAREEEIAPIFKLADLNKLYTSRMEELGVEMDQRVHTTRLKERILAHFPDLQEHKKGRDVFLVFKDDIGSALAKACEYDLDKNTVNLARAAQTVRKDMFKAYPSFNGSFPDRCQEDSVPQLLLSLVSMILEGPSIKDQSCQVSTPCLTIAQLLRYNSVKHGRKGAAPDTHVRHSINQETPLPVYVSLMLHAHTRKRELVDTLSGLGIGISYDRVLRISAEMGNGVCENFVMEKVVCPPKLRGDVFTSAAVDNLDHNPSSTTAQDSFHGTGISLLQHPDCDSQGTDRGIVIMSGPSNVKAVGHLPNYYTDVQPVSSPSKKPPIPSGTQNLLQRTVAEAEMGQEKMWLQVVRDACDNDDVQCSGNISWSAYHAHKQLVRNVIVTPTALLPLFHDQAHSVAMIRHAMDVVKAAVNKLNPGQVPVVTLDQPLFAIAKQIQWNWPSTHGEEVFVIMLGGLHIYIYIYMYTMEAIAEGRQSKFLSTFPH